MQLAYKEAETLEDIAQSIQAEIEEKGRPSLKLIYRGNTFDYTLPVVVVEEDREDWRSVTVSYRGRQYTHKIKPLQPYEKPRAMNWRWQYS